MLKGIRINGVNFVRVNGSGLLIPLVRVAENEDLIKHISPVRKTA